MPKSINNKNFLIYSASFLTLFLFFLGLKNFIYSINPLIVSKSFSIKNYMQINIILFTNYFMLIFFLKKEISQKILPIFSLIFLYFFLTYTLGFFIFEESYYIKYNSDILSRSFFIIILGWSSLFIGYYISEKYFSLRKINFFYFKINNQNKKKIILLIFFILIIFTYSEKNFSSSITIFQQLKEPIVLFFFSFLLLMIIKKNLSSKFYIFFFLFLLLIFILEIITAFYFFIFFTLCFLIITYYIFTNKIPIFTILVLIILGFFLYSIKHQIREEIWHKDKLSSLNRVYLIKNTILKNLSFNNLINIKYSDSKYRRVFHSIDSLVLVSKFTPEIISFLDGETYRSVYSKFIPRFIWKEKPIEIYGNFFGHRYSVLNPDDFATSWNLPVLNEFYINFGFLGVFLGMFFLGFLIRLLILKLRTNNTSDIEILVSSVILYNFFFLEINLSMIIGKVINQFIFFHIFFIFIYLFFLFISKFKLN